MGRGLPPYRTELLGSARHPQSRYSRCLRPLSRRRFGGRTDGIDLRIRRLGVRVPPSALTFSQLNVLIIFVLLIPSASRSSSCRILAASGHPGRLVEPVGVAVRLPWVQVPLDVQRRGDAGMAHDLRDLPEQADTLSFPIPVPRVIFPRSAFVARQIIEAEAGEQPDRGKDRQHDSRPQEAGTDGCHLRAGRRVY